MLNSRIVRPALALLTVAAIGACSRQSVSTTSSPTAARPFTAAMVAQGDSIFHARGCKNCHGPDGKGAENGPNLTDATYLHVDGTFPSYVALITSGVPVTEIKDPSHKRAMSARGGRPTPLSDDEIKSVAAYVFTLSHH